MMDQIKADIESINSNLSVLPTNNKSNKEKYVEYLTECITKYEGKLSECENEIIRRKTEYTNKFESNPEFKDEIEINYDALKLSNMSCASNEKMSINYLLYKLSNTNSGGLDKINEIIITLLNKFSEVGIKLTEKDFVHTESVNLYITTLLYSREKIQSVFNDIYFKDPNLINEISLNIWYLYYKNKSKIDEFFKKKYTGFDFNGYISLYRQKYAEVENGKRSTIRNIYNKFINDELDVNEYLDVKKMDELSKSLVTEITNPNNYKTLYEYKNSLLEYKGYKKYQFIIDDMKELFTHKEEYKDLFSNKLKDIAKEEKNLFSLNGTINKTGLFKPNPQKIAEAKFNRDKSIETLVTLYNELDELAIKEFIKNNFSNETSYYDVLMYTTFNFTYFVKLLEKNNGEIDLTTVERNILELQAYLYDRESFVLKNISIAEERDVLAIVSQKYKLNGIVVDTEKIENEQVDKIVSNIDKMLINYDILRAKLNLQEIKFIIDSTKELTKKG